MSTPTISLNERMPSIWSNWLAEKLQSENLPFPDYALVHYKVHGFNPTDPCKGCVHLNARQIPAPVLKNKKGQKVKRQKTKKEYRCHVLEALNPNKDWQPNWPACKEKK